MEKQFRSNSGKDVDIQFGVGETTAVESKPGFVKRVANRTADCIELGATMAAVTMMVGTGFLVGLKALRFVDRKVLHTGWFDPRVNLVDDIKDEKEEQDKEEEEKK